MADSPLTIAIAGVGLKGRWHAYTARRLGARVVAVVDPDPARARELAGRHPGAEAYDDLRTALGASGAELVHVCTPFASRAPAARTAIEAGVHALVEQPVAATAAEARALFDAAAEAGVLVCAAHRYAYQRGVRQAAALLPSLGGAIRITYTICSAGYDPDGPVLDGILSDDAPHPLSVLRVLLPNSPLDVSGWSVLHSRPGELQLSGELDGVYISWFLSSRVRPTRSDVVVECEGGTIRVDLFHGYAFVLQPEVSRLRKATQPFALAGKTLAVASANLVRRGIGREPAYPGLRSLVSGFYQAVRSGAPLPIPVEDAVAIAAARDELMRQAFPDLEPTRGAV